jgi:hypothetical protein
VRGLEQKKKERELKFERNRNFSVCVKGFRYQEA